MYGHPSRRLLAIVLLSVACGCAPVAVRPSLGPTANPPPQSPPAIDLTGVWQGRSFADCPIVTVTNPGRCGAMEYITFTIFQDGPRISGSYRCAFGNENCRDLAETGVIRNGQMTARLMRLVLMLEDGTMCRFTGMPYNGVIEGRYQCHWGGPMEQGGFRLERSY
jgi:hypothetical protein